MHQPNIQPFLDFQVNKTTNKSHIRERAILSRYLFDKSFLFSCFY